MVEPVSVTAMVAAVGVSMALIEVIKTLIKAVTEKDKTYKLDTIDRKMLVKTYELSQDLYDMHNKFDADGTPIWYTPRSWSEHQKDILKVVQEISHTQEKMCDVIDRMLTELHNRDK